MNSEILQKILDELAEIKNEQKLMRDEQLAMKEEQAEMKKEQKLMRDEQLSMKEEIFTIKETMATKEDVADIPAMKVAIFEIADTVKRIESSQEKHERILDLLSRRSIEQEAELKRIK